MRERADRRRFRGWLLMLMVSKAKFRGAIRGGQSSTSSAEGLCLVLQRPGERPPDISPLLQLTDNYTHSGNKHRLDSRVDERHLTDHARVQFELVAVVSKHFAGIRGHVVFDPRPRHDAEEIGTSVLQEKGGP